MNDQEKEIVRKLDSVIAAIQSARRVTQGASTRQKESRSALQVKKDHEISKLDSAIYDCEREIARLQKFKTETWRNCAGERWGHSNEIELRDATAKWEHLLGERERVKKAPTFDVAAAVAEAEANARAHDPLTNQVALTAAEREALSAELETLVTEIHALGDLHFRTGPQQRRLAEAQFRATQILTRLGDEAPLLRY
jgi:hypothetical protein